MDYSKYLRGYMNSFTTIFWGLNIYENVNNIEE